VRSKFSEPLTRTRVGLPRSSIRVGAPAVTILPKKGNNAHVGDFRSCGADSAWPREIYHFLMLTVIKKMQRDMLIGLAVALGVILFGLVGFLVYRAVSHKGSSTGGCNPACGSHGTCNTKSKSCTCDPGWYGSACQHSSGGDVSPSPDPPPITSPDDPGGKCPDDCDESSSPTSSCMDCCVSKQKGKPCPCTGPSPSPVALVPASPTKTAQKACSTCGRGTDDNPQPCGCVPFSPGEGSCEQRAMADSGAWCDHGTGKCVNAKNAGAPCCSPPPLPPAPPAYATHSCKDVATGGNPADNPTEKQIQFAKQASAYCVSKSKSPDAYCRTNAGTCHGADGVNCCVSPAPA
jgi:hypothetical protein